MVLYKSGTNIPFTLADYLELTLARIGRIAQKGYKRDRYTFYEHEARIILQELLIDAREVLTTQERDRGVLNTPERADVKH